MVITRLKPFSSLPAVNSQDEAPAADFKGGSDEGFELDCLTSNAGPSDGLRAGAGAGIGTRRGLNSTGSATSSAGG